MIKSKTGAIFLGILPGIVIGILLAVLTDIDSDVVKWIMVILVLTGGVLGAVLVRQDTKIAERCCAFDSDGTLILKQRSYFLTKRISIEAHREMTEKFHPAQLVYTGATVGGVHTGGFHIEEAYNSAEFGPATGKYKLRYHGDNDETFPIRRIYLQPDMVSEAAKDPIVSQFLKGNILELSHEAVMPESTAAMVRSALSQNDITLAQNLVQKTLTATQLTRTECETIVKWIGGHGTGDIGLSHKYYIKRFDAYITPDSRAITPHFPKSLTHQIHYEVWFDQQILPKTVTLQYKVLQEDGSIFVERQQRVSLSSGNDHICFELGYYDGNTWPVGQYVIQAQINDGPVQEKQFAVFDNTIPAQPIQQTASAIFIPDLSKINSFEGKTFIVAAVDPKKEDARIRKEIKLRGGELQTRVTKTLDFVVCSRRARGVTTRIDAALDLAANGVPIQIITLDELETLLQKIKPLS